MVNVPVAHLVDHFHLADFETVRINNIFEDGFKYLPIELFKTERTAYIFDARNVAFFEVDSVAFDILDVLREKNVTIDELLLLLPNHSEASVRAAYKDLMEMQADGQLKHYKFQRVPRQKNSQFEQVLSEHMAGLTIFITTQCNLGCSYCIYGGQYDQHEKLSQKPMQWETLRAALDFLEAHSRRSKSIRVDFFGGEPLIAFNTIRKGIDYFESIIGTDGRRVGYTITSNGTVMSDKIIDFLISRRIYIQFSIDGGRESHDYHRRFKVNNRPSFDTILRNLERIYKRDPEYFEEFVRIKAVITKESIDKDDEEFFRHFLIKIVSNKKHFSFLNLEPNYDISKDDEYFDNLRSLAVKLLQVRGVKSESELVADLNPKQKALYKFTLGLFFDAQVANRAFFNGMDSVTFTKGCLTGYSEGAVNADGDISICLKSSKGKNFVIGNVEEGRWYLDKMRDLNTVFHRDWSGCSSCFVQKMCNLCYEKLNGEHGEWVAGRSKFCEFNREKHRIIFSYMLRIMENNPMLWDYLEKRITARNTGKLDGKAERLG